MPPTARYPIKPKTLTLFELCQSINDFRRPLPSNQYQSTPNAAQSLTRRLYLHPLAINTNGNRQLSKLSANTVNSLDSEQRLQSRSEKNREIHHSKEKLSHHGLAILSSSLPLTARSNPKSDTRHSRDKMSIHTDDDTNSDYETNTTSSSWNQSSSLPSIARGTFSSTHTTCTRPSCVMNHRKTYTKPTRSEKVSLWHSLDRTVKRPIPLSPPTSPIYPRTAPISLSRTQRYPRIAPLDPPTVPISPSRTPRYPRIAPLDPPTVPISPPRTPHYPPIAPLDPPTAPIDTNTNFNIENDEPEDEYFNYNSIQKIQIYKRNPRHKSFINEDNDYDDYIYNIK
jgi:hypothetical protein